MTSSPGAQVRAPHPGSRTAAKVLFATFLVVAVGTFVWGFSVANKVRARAKETDGALRSLAWACLCYAQDRSGAWPDSQESLVAAGDAWNQANLPIVGAWPATRVEALAGMTAPSSADDALKIGAVEFSPNRQESPRITARGNPSGLDTLAVVNDWLTAYGHHSTAK